MQILEKHTKVTEKTQIYVPYNILPLDKESSHQAIMRYPEVNCYSFLENLNLQNTEIYLILLILSCSKIQASVAALRNTRGLPWPKGYMKKVNEDILDWLQAMFGFQVITCTQSC